MTSIYDSHLTIPGNDDTSLHPYGPFKSYTWDDKDGIFDEVGRYVVNMHKPWWVIEENMTPCFGNLHAHVMTDSRDCDGSYENDYVQVASQTNFNASRELVSLIKGEPDNFDWNAYEPCTNEAEFRYTMLDLDDWDNEDGHYRYEQIDDKGNMFNRNRATDEGYECRSVTFCYDWSCDLGDRRFRDHTAERAGY